MLYGFSPFLEQLSFLYAAKHQQSHVIRNFVLVPKSENRIIGYDPEHFYALGYFAAKYQYQSRLTTEDKEGKIIMTLFNDASPTDTITLCTKLWSSRSEDEMLI